MDIQKMIAGLENCRFFKGIKADDIENIARLGEIRNYAAGDYIFQQGDFGEHLYVIIEGHVALERSTDLGSRQGSVVIDRLGKGRLLGCWSTLLNEPHILLASACCQKPSEIIILKGSDIREMMKGNIELGFNILERLSFLLRDRVQAAYGALEKI